MFSRILPHWNFLRRQGSGGKGAEGGTPHEQPARTGVSKANPTFSLAADRFEVGESSSRNARPKNERLTPENVNAQPAPSLLGLPQDLLCKILDKLSLSHPNTYEKFENLHTVKATSKALRDSINDYPNYSKAQNQVKRAKAFWDRRTPGDSLRELKLDRMNPNARAIVIKEFIALVSG